MIVESLKKEGCPDRECPEETCADRPCTNGVKPDRCEHSLKPAKMLPLALATSVDALAVGVSLAFLHMKIASAVSFIGITTLVISMVGVKAGSVFGARFRSRAQLAGGVILVLIGVRILLNHLGLL